MSTPIWVHYKEYRTGASDPNGASDVYNRPNRTIWANFTAQHDKDGDHKSGLTSALWKSEQISYYGNGLDDRTITLTDTALNIKMIRILSGEAAYTFFRSEDMSGDLTMSTNPGSPAANMIQSVGTGSFTLGSADAVNKNAKLYYCTVYGV